MELLAWERLSEHIQSGFPVLLPMGGTRGVVIGNDPRAHRLFLRLASELGDLPPASPYAELHIEARSDDGKPTLEIFTTSPHLFKEFHRFAGLLTEEYEHSGLSAVGAFAAVVERWRELALRRDLLSTEEQLGLAGELAVLAALVRHRGPQAISGWTGRMTHAAPERHDFRIGAVDLEVKSTRSARRQHLIHSLRQLEPSAGHRLFLVSLRFEAAGFDNGFNLGMRISVIRALLSSSKATLKEFDEKLLATRYQDDDDSQYRDRTILADTPTLIPVDEECPRLVASTIERGLGDKLASRIAHDVTYRIDVEGLGNSLDSSPDARLLGLSSVE
jgi:hypothetical protein